jgi:hypothetical protein
MARNDLIVIGLSVVFFGLMGYGATEWRGHKVAEFLWAAMWLIPFGVAIIGAVVFGAILLARAVF